MNQYEELIYSLITNCSREITKEEMKILNQASAIYNTYNNLTDELGCPLEVVFGFLTHNITEIIIEYDDFSGNYASPYCTDEDIVEAYVSSIYDRNEIDGISKPELVVETNMGTFPLSDYKEHWWLKKDKSE